MGAAVRGVQRAAGQRAAAEGPPWAPLWARRAGEGRRGLRAACARPATRRRDSRSSLPRDGFSLNHFVAILLNFHAKTRAEGDAACGGPCMCSRCADSKEKISLRNGDGDEERARGPGREQNGRDRPIRRRRTWKGHKEFSFVCTGCLWDKKARCSEFTLSLSLSLSFPFVPSQAWPASPLSSLLIPLLCVQFLFSRFLLPQAAFARRHSLLPPFPRPERVDRH